MYYDLVSRAVARAWMQERQEAARAERERRELLGERRLTGWKPLVISAVIAGIHVLGSVIGIYVS